MSVAVRTYSGAQHPLALQAPQQLQVLWREHRARALADQHHVSGVPPRLFPKGAVPVKQPHILVPLRRAERSRLGLLVTLARAASRALLAFTLVGVSALISHNNNIIGLEKFICALIEDHSMFFGLVPLLEGRL